VAGEGHGGLVFFALEFLLIAAHEGGADLDDGSFGAGGATGADGQGGGNGFSEGDAGTDFSVASGDGVHDFGNAASFGFAGEERYN